MKRLHEWLLGRGKQTRESPPLAPSNPEASKLAESPFVHYRGMVVTEDIIRRHALPDPQPSPGVLTNFLGVRVRPVVHPMVLNALAGTVEAIPLPASWHADIAEWGAALRAVDLARGSFTMLELGCGWGCWMNNMGTAARRAGLAVTVIGVEGDESHLQFAHDALADNGFTPGEWELHRGIAAANAGHALFPRQGAIPSWGLEPVFGASEAQRAEALAAGSHDELPMLALADIISDRRLDLLHIDIQGGEADLLRDAAEVLRERVAYVVVGTHTR
jgi:FkbM family methyltransferase